MLKERLNIRELSKKAGVPFGKIYSIVKSLKDKNLVLEYDTRPKLVYVEDASEIISKLIEQKKETDEKIINDLRELATEIDISKSKFPKFFQIGTTMEDNKQIQLRTFIEAEKEILQILNVHHKPASNRESKALWEKEIEKAVKRNIIFKSIYPKNIVLPKTLQRLNKNYPNNFQVRRLDTDFIRCDIIDNKKVLLKLVHKDPLQHGGILFIENEKFAKNLTDIFNEMWEEAD